MNRVERAMAEAREWPFFDEVRVAVAIKLAGLPVFDTIVDLQNAYAMVVWERFRFDWRSQL